MGLTIYYELHAPEHWTAPRVRAVLLGVSRFARILGFEKVGALTAVEKGHPRAVIGVKSSRARSTRGATRDVFVDAASGWQFHTWPGIHCESASFGLCRYPSETGVDGRNVPTGRGKGWHYHQFCKTQYASKVSVDHFLRCHLGVVAVLDFLKARGVGVIARDDGRFWKTRSRPALLKRLHAMNAIVAAVAGAFKDALSSRPGVAAAPITERKDFERLEAQGLALLRSRRRRGSSARPKRRRPARPH